MKKISIILGMGLSVLAGAQQVHVNRNGLRPEADAGTTAFGAKFKSDNTNWDFSLGNTGSTSNTANFLQTGIGNNAFITARVFGFELEHRTGEGFVWSLTDKSNSNKTTLSWGTFTSPPSGTTAATLNGIAPNRSFNAIRIQNQATGAGSENIFSNLAFNSSATVIGSFFNGTMTPTTPGFNLIGTPANGLSVQWLASDTDLSSFNWSLTGDIQLKGGNNEALKMEIAGRQLQVVPEPGTMAVLGLGLAAFLKRKRK